MNSLEKQNIYEIEKLSQRGKTLSIVDLINDHTLNIEMAAHLLYIVSHGASFLTAARPGNAGKTTLTQCLLTYLPPDAEIVTISDSSMLSTTPPSNQNGYTYYLCHEIGSGRWFGYLWGDDVRKLFSLMNENHFIASCIHADFLDELREILLSEELNVAEEDFRKLDLILFMHLDRKGFKYIRRVSSVYEATKTPSKKQSHVPVFLWDEDSDSFYRQEESPLLKRIASKEEKNTAQVNEELSEYKEFIQWLISEDIRDFRKVRQEVLRFYNKFCLY